MAAPVQTAVTADNDSITSISASFASPVTSGNCVVLAVSTGATGQTFTVTDDKGNSYTLLDHVTDSSNSQDLATFVLGNITNGPETITVTYGSEAGTNILMLAEYGGVFAAANPVDKHKAAITASTKSPSSGAVTTTVNGDNIVSFINCTSALAGGFILSAGSGFTKRLDHNTSGDIDMALQDMVQTTAGSVAGAWSSNTAKKFGASVIALKPVGSTAWAISAGLGVQSAISLVFQNLKSVFSKVWAQK
ncbi:MAG TPA: hypothetical protein VHA37_01880 [Candidatus Saccharimonadales bacterium]|nr:hypothetical protein [Candidatus Saccharimonadales bacterium]